MQEAGVGVEAAKILDLDALAKRVAQLKLEGKRVVHCHGVFDLLHIGHIKHFQAARQEGDVLVVTLTPDPFVNKGPRRPAFNQNLRADALASLECVSYVAINRWPSAVNTITLLKPDVYCKGMVKGEEKRDFSDAIQEEERAILSVGGRFHLTEEVTFGATTLINDHLSIYPAEMRDYLGRFRQKHSLQDTLQPFKSIQNMSILMIGEVIIDEYVFCSVMGKANKDPILAARHLHTERYAGGILAIANHIASFCDNVGLLSMIGEKDSCADFIQQSLNPKIESHLLTKKDSPTILKRRFLEEYLAAKLFEVYEMRNEQLTADEEAAFLAKLEVLLPQYDLVIVADYGHGLMTERIIDVLCKKAKFLAVNAQTNAGNRGFNFITRYPRADFISIDEPEARLEARNREADSRELLRLIASRMNCPLLLLTLGSQGSLLYAPDTGFHTTPAFALKAVDRLGAGDAVLALTAPCAALGLPMDVIGFIGNVAGAEACAVMGNKSSIQAENFFRHVRSLVG